MGYTSSDGSIHDSLERAQHAELTILLKVPLENPSPSGGGATFSMSVISEILKHREQIIDILTTKPNSLPKARKINGGTKKRKPAVMNNDPGYPDSMAPTK
jgi:hypothetical protein